MSGYGYGRRPEMESFAPEVRNDPMVPAHIGARRTVQKQAQDIGQDIGEFIPENALDPTLIDGTFETLAGWSHNLAFSSTDSDTVAWASGDITLASGTTYSITGANTGNMAAVTYIYLDTAVSATALQTSTTAGDSVGSGKILVAVAKNVAAGKAAEFQVFGGQGASVFITADNVAANTLTANEVAANTLTGAEILTMDLTAKNLTADTGTVGGWTLASTKLSSGSVEINASTERMLFGSATAPLTGVGIFLGKDGADYEFRAGNPAGEYLHWDGSGLTVKGTLDGADGTFAGNLSAAGGTFTGTLSGVDGTFSGTLSAASGTFGTITAGNLATGSFDVDITNERLLLGSATGPLAGTGVFLGKDGSDYELRVGNPSGDYIHWDGTDLTVGGTITSDTFTASGATFRSGAASGVDIEIGYDAPDTYISFAPYGSALANYASIKFDGGDLTISNSSWNTPVIDASINIESSGTGNFVRIGATTFDVDAAIECDDDCTIDGTIWGKGELHIDGALNHDGSTIGFFGVTPATRSTGWTVTNDNFDQTFDANSTTIDELADVLGTLIGELVTYGILGT